MLGRKTLQNTDRTWQFDNRKLIAICYRVIYEFLTFIVKFGPHNAIS